MAIYSLSLNSTVTTTNAPAWGFLAQADENPTIYEIHLDLGAATASSYGFGRAATAGTQTAGVSVLPHGPANSTTGKSTCAVAWSAAPTVPTQYLRRKSLPATIGAGVIWTFPGGLGVAAASEMVIWNLATNSASLNVTVVGEE
ncbi:MAG: hypothetical protein ACXWDN_07055 [Limisphaerales bacterium]